jgi:hypothetical protein
MMMDFCAQDRLRHFVLDMTVEERPEHRFGIVWVLEPLQVLTHLEWLEIGNAFFW